MKILVAMAVMALAATPAYAGKYACTFIKGSGALKQCDIASGTSDRLCVHPHSATLQGACFVDASGSSDRLQCIYFNGSASVADLTKPPGAAAIRAGAGALAEQPGFIAGGVTLGPPATLVLVAGYRESSSEPLLQVVCTPKP